MKTQPFVTVLLVTGISVSAAAQDTGRGVQLEGDELAVLPEFKTVDTNKDGMIAADETQKLAKMLEEEHNIVFRFEVADENQDGVIDNREYVAYDRFLKERLGIA